MDGADADAYAMPALLEDEDEADADAANSEPASLWLDCDLASGAPAANADGGIDARNCPLDGCRCREDEDDDAAAGGATVCE